MVVVVVEVEVEMGAGGETDGGAELDLLQGWVFELMA